MSGQLLSADLRQINQKYKALLESLNEHGESGSGKTTPVPTEVGTAQYGTSSAATSESNTTEESSSSEMDSTMPSSDELTNSTCPCVSSPKGKSSGKSSGKPSKSEKQKPSQRRYLNMPRINTEEVVDFSHVGYQTHGKPGSPIARPPKPAVSVLSRVKSLREKFEGANAKKDEPFQSMSRKGSIISFPESRYESNHNRLQKEIGPRYSMGKLRASMQMPFSKGRVVVPKLRKPSSCPAGKAVNTKSGKLGKLGKMSKDKRRSYGKPSIGRQQSKQSQKQQDSSMWTLPSVWKQQQQESGPKLPKGRKSKIQQSPESPKALEEELQLMSQLDQREANLSGVINRNENYMEHSNRVLSDMKQEMRNSMDVLVHSMQAEMTAVEETMKGQMLAAHSRIQRETDSMRQSVSRYKAIRKTLKENLTQSVPMRRRSVELMAQQMPKGDGWTGSQNPIQLHSEVEWQSIVNQFKNQISKMMDVSLEVSADSRQSPRRSSKPVEYRGGFRVGRQPDKNDVSLYDFLGPASQEQGQRENTPEMYQGPSEDSDNPDVAMDQQQNEDEDEQRLYPNLVRRRKQQNLVKERLYPKNPMPIAGRGEAKDHDLGKQTHTAVAVKNENSGEFASPSQRNEEQAREQAREHAREQAREQVDQQVSGGPDMGTREISNFNEIRDIELNVLCITKEADIHFCELTAKLPFNKSNEENKRKRRPKKMIWAEVPKESGLVKSDRHHVKYPSFVYHKQSNEMYRFGGVVNGTQLNRSEKYHVPSNQWTTLRPDPLARQDALSLLLTDDTIINIGGAANVRWNSVQDQQVVRNWKFFDKLTIYDLQSQTWRQYHQSMKKLRHMQEARYSFAGLSMAGKKNVVVFGGNGIKGRMSSVEMYDYSENEWTYLEPMPVVKAKHAAVWYGEGAIIAGGDLKSESKQCYQMDLHRNQWMKLPELNEKRSRPVLQANLEKSCVIAAGDSHDLKSFEILDLRVNAAVWMLSEIESHPGAMEYRAGMIALS